MATQELDLVKFLMQRYGKMQSDRAPFENDWMDIRDLVRPISVGYHKMSGTYVTLRTEFMYDGTAPDALEQLAAALHSYLTNPAERFFELEIDGNFEVTQDPDALAWLELVSDIIYDSYRREDVMLNTALHEVFLDIGSFGTAILNQEWSSKINDILFSSKPISDCYLLENSENRVDTVYRKVVWTKRQLAQEFGEPLPPLIEKEKNQDKWFDILHCVYPRDDRDPKNPSKLNKKFASVWICTTTNELLKIDGYDSMCYHTPRWTKLSGEIYGRGPAKKCLPDIKMLNAMEKTLLKAGQKAVDPPTVIADEGFLLPIRTSPGALIFKEAGTENPEPLKFEGNLPWGLEQANGKREFIQKCFYADWIKMEKQNVEMTAYEVADRREEKLRMMAPMLGRLASELLGPMIARSYFLLSEHARIPLAPPTIQGRKLKVGYMSPASRAQTGVKAVAMGRFIQELIPMLQIDPGIMDAVDMDKYVQALAIARGTPRIILRSSDAIAQMRDQRQKQQAMQQLAQIAEPASKAVKNLADAQKSGGGGGLPGLGQ